MGTGHWSACTNVYSINPIRQLAMASPPTSPDIPHSRQAAGISWCVLGTGSGCVQLPAFGVCQLRRRTASADYDNGGDSRLAARHSPLADRSSSPIAFVYDRMLGSSVDFLINARILRSVPSATTTATASLLMLLVFCCSPISLQLKAMYLSVAS